MTAEQSESPVAAFWRFDTDDERRIVRDVLYRRFPRLTSVLVDCFTAVSTYDIAHPGNPDGDNDVVIETLTLFGDVNGNLGRVSAGRLNDTLAEGAARSLGHATDLGHVREAIQLVSAKSATIDWEALVWVEATDFDGSVIPEEIRPLSAPFWTLQTTRERTTVNTVLARRFPQTSAVLSSCLEEADTQDIVYPDQSPEYTEVVREVLTLLSDVYADLSRVTPVRLENVLYEALARCFGEAPEEHRVPHAVNLIAEHVNFRSS
ncbi:hypothetical protein [Amycolatopsis keratiniphila]|uniref:Uncharacterized protein n=1 Tax=Amycolatopsis keratiniphila TaxID=129921 RepID=R4T815_9PSEU|nr:hypothetical protein [Amycolatopsis keratiniphila]AGM07112.1 hypothetical protein AORI_4528 [Amycolatopsis keratiniphila]